MDTTKIAGSDQYLTFRLGDEEFALEITKVREVLDFTEITKVPRAPEFMRGVINLRGNVVLVIDLRLNLGMTANQRTVDTCIVIVEVNMGGELIQLGALADSVQEVVNLERSQIEPPPRLGTKLNTEFIKGMGKRDENFIIILDIDKVLSNQDIAAINEINGRTDGPHTESVENASVGA